MEAILLRQSKQAGMWDERVCKYRTKSFDRRQRLREDEYNDDSGWTWVLSSG